MEAVSTILYPRSLPHRIAPNQALTLVGQITNLNEQSRTVTL